MDMIALQNRLGAMSGSGVTVVGDIMVDRFVHGAVSRVSAEAPVPILARISEQAMLGAAGNVARNIVSLGGAAALIGVLGVDAAAAEARALIAAGSGPIAATLISDPDRPTTTKVRFVSAGQQLMRVDHEAARPVEGEVEQAILQAIGASATRAILLSDYGKGVVTDAVIQACLVAAKASGAPLIVDSKARHFGRYGAADVVKPNAAELAFATDLPTSTDAEVEVALEKALTLAACGAILVTRAAQGMSLAVRGQPVRHFRRPAPEVF
ncbi:MAG TPA: PfkB family carbohydrate kinase, partial [Caulobacteraceae bacterium]